MEENKKKEYTIIKKGTECIWQSQEKVSIVRLYDFMRKTNKHEQRMTCHEL